MATKKPVAVFMGDSLTEYMPPPQPRDFEIRLAGYSGMGVEFLRRMAGRILNRHQPDIVWLCIGINDVWGFEQSSVRPSAWEESFADLCRIITGSGAKLYASTLMPVENCGFFSGFNLEHIRTMNAIIVRQAQAWGAEVVDSYGHFADASGYLPPGCTEDGVHLTDETYRRWTPFICASLGLS
ncbi:MAG: SGNH/GDSL hydrolase family protein [Desulfarculales bacterium]|jgi:lysophospholipase L1-like esterase|nr:SGNH/GDSL hydrolase family protein [Desulfarculales bacterium]